MTIVAAALLLAGCGDNGDEPSASSETSPGTTTSGEPSADVSSAPTDGEPDDPLLAALEALAPDFEGAKSCTEDGPPEVVDRGSDYLRSGSEWFGGPQPDASGVRPATTWRADFCLPEQGGFSVAVDLNILEFETADDAAAWVDDLSAVTEAGQPVHSQHTPEPGSCSADNPDLATRAASSVAGDDAIDVVVTEPCGPLAEFPEELAEWDPATYSVADAGRWAVVVFVNRSGGGTVEVGDPQVALQTMVRANAVEPDLQRAAVETLTEELADA